MAVVSWAIIVNKSNKRRSRARHFHWPFAVQHLQHLLDTLEQRQMQGPQCRPSEAKLSLSDVCIPSGFW